MDTMLTILAHSEEMLADWRFYAALSVCTVALLSPFAIRIQQQTIENGHSVALSWFVALGQTAIPIPLCVFIASQLGVFAAISVIATMKGIAITLIPSLIVHVGLHGIARQKQTPAKAGVTLAFPGHHRTPAHAKAA